MDYTLELTVVPVSDVDRAKAFYLDQARLAGRRASRLVDTDAPAFDGAD